MSTLKCVLPYSRTEYGLGDPLEEEGRLEFRLLFKGQLLPSGNRNTRPAEKQDIRQKFHPQLRRQWRLNNNLQQLAARRAIPFPPGIDTQESILEYGIKTIASDFQMFGFNFAPMVMEKDDVRCAIDILLLRPEESRFICTQGDVDGQIKTLFDALSIPRSASGLNPPAQGEDPLYVLLESDRIISEVHVTAEQLLLLPDEHEVKANDAFAIIHVKLSQRHPGTFENYFA